VVHAEVPVARIAWLLSFLFAAWLADRLYDRFPLVAALVAVGMLLVAALLTAREREHRQDAEAARRRFPPR
jgi:hypothetical protein